jgi:hypothetical protein
MTELTFQQLLWADFTAQRPEPDEPTLHYGGAGRSEDKLRHFTGMPFYQALLLETQNILRHIRRVEWLRPPQVNALELYVYLRKDTVAREVLEALNGIFYHAKPDDEIRRGEIHDIFQRVG